MCEVEGESSVVGECLAAVNPSFLVETVLGWGDHSLSYRVSKASEDAALLPVGIHLLGSPPVLDGGTHQLQRGHHEPLSWHSRKCPLLPGNAERSAWTRSPICHWRQEQGPGQSCVGRIMKRNHFPKRSRTWTWTFESWAVRDLSGIGGVWWLGVSSNMQHATRV